MVIKKTYVYVLFSTLSLLFAGCDKNAELNEDIAAGFLRLNSNVIYPTNSSSDYRVEFQGKDISETYFNRSESEGELTVYSKDSDTPELTIIYNIAENGTTIDLIKLPGKGIELYKENDYISFSTVIALFDGYKAILNDQEIVDGLNYIKKENTSGTLEFVEEGGTDPVSTIEDFVVENGESIVLLQASDTEFVQLAGGGEEESAPDTDNLSKIRFFYPPIGRLNVDSIRLDFIAFDMDMNEIIDYKSVVVKKGELSSYVELDAALFKDNYSSAATFGYSIYNADTEELIEDAFNGNNTFEIYQASSGDNRFKAGYKFTTYQITNRTGYPSKVIEELSERW